MIARKPRHSRAAQWAALIAAFLLSTGPAGAQAQDPASAPAQTAKPDCNSPSPTRARAGGANVAIAAGESLQHKNWQPVGGMIEFTINSFEPIEADAPVTTCFRWKTTPPQDGNFIEAIPSRLELTNQGKTLKVTVAVPPPRAMPAEVAARQSTDRAVWIVPLAEVRTLVINKGKAGTLDVWSVIGITHPTVALALALLAVALGLIALNLTARYRIKHSGTQAANWFLRIIATPAATASLSQFQILLWTFVVLASAVYVALLSGQLIEITTGTLVLLGISGLATLGTQAHDATQLAAKQSAADAATKDRAAAEATKSPDMAQATEKAADAEAKLAAVTAPPEDKRPRWSDLLVNESDDGRRQVDVTRAQVLLFTLITAGFVIITVIATYVIPEIPQGFLVLMGISNGVYIGSKVVQSS